MFGILHLHLHPAEACPSRHTQFHAHAALESTLVSCSSCIGQFSPSSPLAPPDIMIFPMQIEKVYEPQRFEPHWAQWWIDSGIFRASPENPGRAFSLVIPPPNVTGILHIGHMLEHTEIDVTVRWHRMIGDNTLWLPGTDHAGIATQMVVARQLK